MVHNNQRQLSNGLKQAGEPIAIIGIGCRFPGEADDWRTYWNNLEQGVDAISETPEDRWNLQKFYAAGDALPGKTQSRWGGYVSNIAGFDPELFRISPREAASMDPQQRMLLEVAYRAIEDAGLPVEKIAGRQVAVFTGISSFDYAVAGLSYEDRGVIDAYSNTGGSSSIAANRVSYCFDLRGPSVAVDTACSSSLVALHMACESIWRGDAEMALASGVNALIMPDFYVAFSQLGVLSPDGRCKTFDARANGYVRSEGAGAILLKPLSAALRDNDPVYAVVRSTALNQDGRTPGMTVPSQAAQETLMRAACEKAGIAPGDLQYVEAHGTGTAVGDPIEATAIGSVVSDGRPGHSYCYVGSVKTNIGHLEAGAGMASVIKVALSMHHEKIPAHLHFENANPEIDLDRLRLRVPTQTIPWESSAARVAGINGFGYGGANGHIIVEQAPEQALRTTASVVHHASSASKSKPSTAASAHNALSAPVLLPLSACSKPALAKQAGEFADALEQMPDEIHLAEIAGYVAHRRAHHSQRTTACALGRDDMVSELRTIAESSADELAEELSPSKLAVGPAFVCSGQGPQWWGMGRGMLKFSPAFRSVIKRCEKEFSRYSDWSLTKELTRSEQDSRMQKTSIAQPSIFAIQVALAAVWESWGVKPTALVGHSVGEIAAAYLSGGLSFEDACCVALHRGRTMDLASSEGAMVAAGLPADEVPEWIAGFEQDVSLAAINGPSSVTISGEQNAIESIAQRLEEKGVFCRRLAVEYAFHSPQMDPVKDELLRALNHIEPKATHTPMISTVTGALIDGELLDADYWWQNVRQSVRFADAMTALAESDYAVAVEVGPHPVLAYSINECFQDSGGSVRTVASLNRQQDDLQVITKSLGRLYAMGFQINWSGFYNKPTRRIELPGYPFQLQNCWSESFESKRSRMEAPAHPLLGERADSPAPQWQQRVDLKLQTYLADHVVRGSTMYPAAAMLDAALAASQQVTESTQVSLQRVQLLNACTLEADRPQWIQTTYFADRRLLAFAFRSAEAADWRPLARTGVSQQVPDVQEASVELSAAKARCTASVTQEAVYAHCVETGLNYGPEFKGVQRGVRIDHEAVVEVSLSTSEAGSSAGHVFHPALLDSCFHSMLVADPSFGKGSDGLYLPLEIERINLFSQPTGEVTVHCQMRSKTEKQLICDLKIYDASGQLCVTIDGFISRRVGTTKTRESTEDLIYSYSWQPVDAADSAERDAAQEKIDWLVFMDEGGFGKELAERLLQRGDQVREIYRHNSQVAKTSTAKFYQVDPENRSSFTEAIAAATADAGSVVQVVYLWGLDVPESHVLSTQQLDESTQLSTLALMHLIQSWDEVGPSEPARLAILTTGAQSEEHTPELLSVAQGPLVGMGRVIASEYGQLRARLIDLPVAPSTTEFDDLVTELLTADDEDEVMWRDGLRQVRRFLPQRGKLLSEEATENLPSQLQVGGSSGIEELTYRTKPARPLASGEVEIQVEAAALNFADVMKALDLYPGMEDGPVDLGAECAGRITRTAPGSAWQVGDPVVAIAPGSFGTHVTVSEALVAAKPESLSFEQAAALPVAFLTADYAMNHCAGLGAGDSILIHSASGGVGLAAMQLAARAGIRVYATAGTDEKRQYVLDRGAVKAMDSRSLAFADELLEATGGEGVDAVLNSLPGEAIVQGLRTLRIGGRFMEIGKRDIYADAPLGLYPMRNNLSLFAIDLDQLFKKQPKQMGVRLRDLMKRFETGELAPLPTREYDSNDAVAAFKYMQQGKHIGKIVVRYRHRPAQVQAGTYAPIQFNQGGTYWLAGGLGGFGLQVARWMVDHGARHLVLGGRSQRISNEAQDAIGALEAKGAAVTVIPADVTKPEEVKRVLSKIDDSLPKLVGVIHTAMVLEDKLLVDLDRDTLERVLRPKMLGAWNLHQQTLGRELECFVLFSSLSSVFGHAGQANYSAANAMLDSLAYYRRAQGLPALVMNWGHLGDAGYLAQREELGERLKRQGVLSFSVEQATDVLEYALQTKAIQLSCLRIDWRIWRGLGITDRVSPRFAHLLIHDDEVALGAVASAANMRSAAPQARWTMVDRSLRGKVGSLLGIPADKISADRALLEMGLDSLMAVELRNWIEGHLEIGLPISVLMQGDSFDELVTHISHVIGGDDASGQTAGEADSAVVDSSEQESDTAKRLLDELPEMDSEQVTDLLSQLLKEQES
ncbi:MAG: hypothetical protein Aurels2KO_08860 [Aureliella sp.]